MRTGIAKIPVQNSFCEGCAEVIRKRILKDQGVQNLVLFPSESLIVFNFNWANQVSEVLNILTKLGYPPEGDEITTSSYRLPFCTCKSKDNKYGLAS